MSVCSGFLYHISLPLGKTDGISEKYKEIIFLMTNEKTPKKLIKNLKSLE